MRETEVLNLLLWASKEYHKLGNHAIYCLAPTSLRQQMHDSSRLRKHQILLGLSGLLRYCYHALLAMSSNWAYAYT